MGIELRDVGKRFGAFTVLHDINLDVSQGELVALLGPSGSGKTTLLRVIAGLEAPDAGAVLLDGRDATQDSVRDRRVGFVFQHYALFRHLDVFENVAFGLRVRPRANRPPEREIRRRVGDLLSLVQLEMLADRFPSQLSGGQRQRVALARALAVEPRVLLLDEPFGALDAKVRKELRRWLRRLHDEIHVTSLFVTHDQDEALELADRVVIMNHGHIEQVGTPEQVYVNPSSPFVLDFLGEVNLFHCRVERGQVFLGNTPLDLPAPAAQTTEARVYIRPHVLSIETQQHNGGLNQFPARVVHINPAGPIIKVELETPWGDVARVDVPRERFDALQIVRGANVFLRPLTRDIFVVSESTPREAGAHARPSIVSH